MDTIYSPTAIRAASTIGLTASAALLGKQESLGNYLTKAQFTGGGLALSIGTAPTISQGPKPLIRKQWRQTYDTGFALGPPTAALTFILLSYTSYAQRAMGPTSTSWQGLAVVAIGNISIIPFTWLFLLPVNTKLLADTDDKVTEVEGLSEAELKATVRWWGTINGWRCVLPALTSLVGLWLILE